jgi:Fungal chitosanase of glycosyl hydrolase group 75
MARNFVFFLATIALCSSAALRGLSAPSAPTPVPADDKASAESAADCDTSRELPERVSQIPDREKIGSAPQTESRDAASVIDTVAPAVDFGRDLNILAQKQSDLARCTLAIEVRVPAQDSSGACSGELLLNFEMRHDGEAEKDIPIGRLAGTAAFFYESGMTIDADGAPNAYHPDNTGLDDLANAGAPGRWEGLAKDPDGEPFIQGPEDPFPGYYVSSTALADHSKAVNDPSRYVDASKIPFVVLPGQMARQVGARTGDFAVVFNLRNGKSSFAIFGDVGPHDRIGEGSMALAENLGIRSNARNGGAHSGIFYLVFPGSGNGKPRTIEEISAEGEKLLQAWEGSISRGACTTQLPARVREGN